MLEIKLSKSNEAITWSFSVKQARYFLLFSRTYKSNMQKLYSYVALVFKCSTVEEYH